MKTQFLSVIVIAFLSLVGCQYRTLTNPVLPDDFLSYNTNPNPEDLAPLPIYDHSAVPIGKAGWIKLAYVGKETPAGPVTEVHPIYIAKQAQGKQIAYVDRKPVGWPSVSHDILVKARARSTYHKPFEFSLNEKPFWAIHEMQCLADERKVSPIQRRCHSILELYDQNPSSVIKPVHVLAVGTLTQELPDGPMRAVDSDKSPFFIDKQLLQLKEVSVGPTGVFNKVMIHKWKPNIRNLLKGQAVIDEQTSGARRVTLETLVNDALIEWKVIEMVELFKKLGVDDLRQLSIETEKTLLAIDLKVKSLKDLMDQDARNLTQTAPVQAADLVHVLDQRKAIIMSVIGTLKQAITSKK